MTRLAVLFAAALLLAPAALASNRHPTLNELENETGISGDVNVTIKAQDPTSPAVIAWAEAVKRL